jgi:hypothetical protein
VFAASLALVVTAGCGGSAGDGAAAESAGADLTKANFASEVMSAQAKEQTAHLEAKVSAQGQKISMAGDMQMAKDVAFDLSMTSAAMGGDARFILVDKVIYLKMPGLTQSDKFIKVDAGHGNDPVAQMFSQMMGQLDPSKAFQAFDAITSLKERGSQEIDGVETTHYTVAVDTQKALKAQGMAGQVPASQMPKTIEYDVWVDGEHLVRKLRMDIQGSTVDMGLSQWGEPVDIAAPPSSQVTDMGALMGQMGGAPKGG